MTIKIQQTKKTYPSSSGQVSLSPLYVELPYKPPASVYERFRTAKTVLLESIKGSEKTGRYSFIAIDPYLEFKVKDSVVEILRDAGYKDLKTDDRRPLGRVRELLLSYQQKKDPHLPPFQGGAIGLLSYDFVHYFERLPSTAGDELQIPDAHFFLVDRLFAFDHTERKAYAIVCPGARRAGLGTMEKWRNGEVEIRHSDLPYPGMYDETGEFLSRMTEEYNRAGDDIPDAVIPARHGRADIVYETTKKDYMDMVVRAKEYIHAGDIFQANLSQRLSAEIKASPWTLYSILRQINPSPFSAFVDFGEYQIVSSSPERLVRLKDGIAETRPIAGTRPRGTTAAEDERLRADLLLDEKERAEHIMLIDLERNDLGRVCSYGTVRVDELMITEDYSHVIHIVSNVKGILSAERDAFSLLRATFPGGTITGVPKVRCMEIIDELEPVVRGPYTGSIGYIGFSGDMDLNIIIRTFVIKNGRAYVQAGAGIVADSVPEREYYESLNKAEALLSTLERL
ncbi:MAG TPA: anthranilate synthase component I family protein [Nitrospirae bacterium]|mgnify:CR=1 FL=1|nr:anthranilate synthase component I family protein [Nitrospirota bacterium]